MFNKIEDIEAWQVARQLAKEIWLETQQGAFSKDWKLKDQINDAAGSAMDNIAEGFGRGGNKEFSAFLSIARGSAQEVKSQLHRAYDREHFAEERFRILMQLCITTIVKIHYLFKLINESSYTGSKYYRRQQSDPDAVQEVSLCSAYEQC